LLLPILYTFRRCPYAIRARLAIINSQIEVAMHEVELRNKPPALLACSPKGTVPVLVLPDGRVIDESLDIMRWALAIHDPGRWLGDSADLTPAMSALIAENDGPFKRNLDRYKYANRYPEQPLEYHRAQAELFLDKLDNLLIASQYLCSNEITIADMAIMPFVRQLAAVDPGWFAQSRYARLRAWLDGLLQLPLFAAVMQKR
jgi:glutathione S-transferase